MVSFRDITSSILVMSPCFLGKPVFSKMYEFPENFSLLSRILCHYDPKELETAEVLSIPVQLVIVLGMIAHDPLMSLFLTCKFPSVPRTLLSHPSILVLPMFTFYTFRTTNTCWSKKQGDAMELVMSRKDTLINVCISPVGFCAVTVLMAAYLGLRVFHQPEM